MANSKVIRSIVSHCLTAESSDLFEQYNALYKYALIVGIEGNYYRLFQENLMEVTGRKYSGLR